MKGNLSPLRGEEPTTQFLPQNDPSSSQNLFEDLSFHRNLLQESWDMTKKKLKKQKAVIEWLTHLFLDVL